VNRIKSILKSRLTGNVAIAGVAALAVIYTVPHSTSGSNPVELALSRVSATGSATAAADNFQPGWDLANLDHARVD